jgi:hypothetical protein
MALQLHLNSFENLGQQHNGGKHIFRQFLVVENGLSFMWLFHYLLQIHVVVLVAMVVVSHYFNRTKSRFCFFLV